MGKEFKAEEKRLRDIIIGWAREKNEIKFDENLCYKNVIPYRTAKMTALIPDVPDIIEHRCKAFALEYWRHEYFYAFEIIQLKTKLTFQLVFNYDSISDSTKKICEQIYSNYRMHHKKDNLEESYRNVCEFDIDIKECDDNNQIIQKLNQLFYHMKGYETFIIYKLGEKDQASPQ